MKVVLVHLTDFSEFYGEDKVLTYHVREDARRYCAVTTSSGDETIRKIVEVDLTSNVITELELQLDGLYKLQLVEKVRDRQA